MLTRIVLSTELRRSAPHARLHNVDDKPRPVRLGRVDPDRDLHLLEDAEQREGRAQRAALLVVHVRALRHVVVEADEALRRTRRRRAGRARVGGSAGWRGARAAGPHRRIAHLRSAMRGGRLCRAELCGFFRGQRGAGGGACAAHLNPVARHEHDNRLLAQADDVARLAHRLLALAEEEEGEDVDGGAARVLGAAGGEGVRAGGSVGRARAEGRRKRPLEVRRAETRNGRSRTAHASGCSSRQRSQPQPPRERRQRAAKGERGGSRQRSATASHLRSDVPPVHVLDERLEALGREHLGGERLEADGGREHAVHELVGVAALGGGGGKGGKRGASMRRRVSVGSAVWHGMAGGRRKGGSERWRRRRWRQQRRAQRQRRRRRQLTGGSAK